MPGKRTIPAMQFDDAAQQREAAALGMWVFLATEVLFFGGVFLAYGVYRNAYPEAFAAGSDSLDLLLGSLNTAVLLTSGLTMALAVHAAGRSKTRSLTLYLFSTAALGLLFLGIKGFEYYHKIQSGHLPGAGFHFDGPKMVGVYWHFVDIVWVYLFPLLYLIG